MQLHPDFTAVRLTRGACQHVECSWSRCKDQPEPARLSPFARRALAAELPAADPTGQVRA